mmetsp:Transcript_880/g.1322  ORF Transcript_880/g.1322 Transcript_880/m.1322 type:complete len:610 (-) Transcript_880:346-2175(-)|eukprot:CAMPEP_0194110810 /NCGR_PEP_ID=MMETSP0150-20130528/9970_1 /TAXON_ID=122233 /ORGANISM="Chaetoceros debilis, Strain MM31A-1" /LENGTH=609 /DNA_ID=CAMNT_0038800085 /DNA_START=67 /DNA_END=1896 /DNA_ORIENTATION=+
MTVPTTSNENENEILEHEDEALHVSMLESLFMPGEGSAHTWTRHDLTRVYRHYDGNVDETIRAIRVYENENESENRNGNGGPSVLIDRLKNEHEGNAETEADANTNTNENANTEADAESNFGASTSAANTPKARLLNMNVLCPDLSKEEEESRPPPLFTADWSASQSQSQNPRNHDADMKEFLDAHEYEAKSDPNPRHDDDDDDGNAFFSPISEDEDRTSFFAELPFDENEVNDNNQQPYDNFNDHDHNPAFDLPDAGMHKYRAYASNEVDSYTSADGKYQYKPPPVIRVDSFATTRIERFPGLQRKKVVMISIIVVILVSLSLVGASLGRLSALQYGVSYDRWAKHLDNKVQQMGLYFGPIGYYFVKFPSTQLNTEVRDTCVSKDGLRIRIEASYQYKLQKEYMLDAIRSFRDYDTWKTVVDFAGSSAIQTACADWGGVQFYNQWRNVKDSMHDAVQTQLEGSFSDIYDGIFAEMISFQLTSVKLPDEYTAAVEEKRIAKEEVSIARYERVQDLIKANTDLQVAGMTKEKVMLKAYHDANITLSLAEIAANKTRFMIEQETLVLAQAQQFLSLDINGVLSFMANKLYEQIPELTVRNLNPASISFRAS